ncbi:hypothetical protein PSN45_004023 [Yamadazyma tenuis]|uniref:GPN-loop GTPase 2 n=1 Tax=Candida tenuis (strain ATCC 10573 / BCRC 21748 / CBS 615 / JCM 9827 / NBRC 10315 / NRRL Y-1498 / VKM Y-70) TaxID=590646 RepID=G3B3Z2_CANTC|nr:uncharacterized protein CANTEDRAFT_113930 [Yamadazyma tenuis ATCC 10573]EGV63896.1 hypothetical protein CANTEDRAFT_113930 [Yamadazyma tenuis ATCC 10573]WEJ96484.1 hypothetical protein PSN45_004023 [Yamadazyma tenuis]
MFGQIVIGPPGSGKSTYCYGMHQFLSAIGRKPSIINLDPANDSVPYPVDLDIRDYITVEEIMDELSLGPNGSLMYAMTNLSDHLIEEFIQEVKELVKSGSYLVFDCPGQVELFTHDNSMFRLFKKLTKADDLRLCCVNLVDSVHLVSPSSYISVLLLSLRSMLQMNMPQINVISKIDMIKSYGQLPFRLDYYTEVQDLKYLSPMLEKESNSPLGKRFVHLSETIGDIIEDFNLVSFEVLSVENKKSMINLLAVIDKANGYSFGTNEISGDTIWSDAVRSSTSHMIDIDIHERWIENKEKLDEQEQKESEEIMSSPENTEQGVTQVATEDDQWEMELKNWENQTGLNAIRR